MIENSSLTKLMRCKIIIEEVEKGTYPTGEYLLDRIARWLEGFKELIPDIKTEISERTLSRDRKNIKEIFNIDISYDTKRKGYYIGETYNKSDRILRALDAIHVFFIQKNIPNANKHIRFAPRQASGSEHFFHILKAIEDKKKVQFFYEQYEKQEETQRSVSPLGLKEFKGFWYMIAEDEKGIKTFGLDRIKGLNITLENAVSRKGFNIDEYYKHCYGIVRLPNDEPQEIIIKTTAIKAKYYKANKLHTSQNIIKTQNDDQYPYTITLHMYLTYDLQQELRSHGEKELKVIQPENALENERYF